MTRLAYCDIETNAIDHPDKCWLVGGKMACTGEVFKFENIHEDPVARKAANEWHLSLDKMVGHNFIQYDLPLLNKWLDNPLDPRKVLDTLIVSRTVDYNIDIPLGGGPPHSLKSWGIRLGVFKGDFHEFGALTDEMVTYWYGDLDTTEAVFNHFKGIIYDTDWSKSLRAEHDLQIELVRSKYHGFHFNADLAKHLLGGVTEQMGTLELQFQEDFPPTLQPVNTIKYQVKGDGTPYATVTKAKEKYPLTQRVGDDLVCHNFIYFNPGASKNRADVLWANGWKPFDKTATHIKFGRLKVGDPYGKKIKSMSQEFYNEKKATLERYGYTVSEDNLSTLPNTALPGAKALAQWLTLEGRRSSLVEWINQVCDDGRIHGTINNIGAWTGRCAHKAPNTANISSVFHGKPNNAVEEIKSKYDKHLRECWDTPDGSYLVGCDADGIQLRVLADYMWRYFDADMYAKAIMEGKKEDETDIHNMNKNALGVQGGTRDMAKTFIYSWLLGAGAAKTAAIMNVTVKEATAARARFEKSIDGLAQMKRRLIPYIAEQGYFKGYDDRKVKVPSEYKTLAGILQSGESVLMKHTLLNFHADARKEGIDFKMVAFVHDEYQIEVKGTKEEAEHLGKLVATTMLRTGEELGFRIPTPGDYNVGRNWADTH
jgi:DNA polymerase-1